MSARCVQRSLAERVEERQRDILASDGSEWVKQGTLSELLDRGVEVFGRLRASPVSPRLDPRPYGRHVGKLDDDEKVAIEVEGLIRARRASARSADERCSSDSIEGAGAVVEPVGGDCKTTRLRQLILRILSNATDAPQQDTRAPCMAAEGPRAQASNASRPRGRSSAGCAASAAAAAARRRQSSDSSRAGVASRSRRPWN
jgi:hypothetical protein